MSKPTPEQPAALSPEDMARIRAEETYRTQVRAEVAQAQAVRTAPSYWAGFILNCLVTGLGFAVIGEWGLMLAWLIGTIAFSIATSFLILPVMWVLALVNYRTVYVSKYK